MAATLQFGPNAKQLASQGAKVVTKLAFQEQFTSQTMNDLIWQRTTKRLGVDAKMPISALVDTPQAWKALLSWVQMLGKHVLSAQPSGNHLAGSGQSYGAGMLVM